METVSGNKPFAQAGRAEPADGAISSSSSPHRESATVASFISLVQDPNNKVGYGQLLECGRAIATLRLNQSDSATLSRYDGPLVPSAVRSAVESAMAIEHALRNPAADRFSVARFAMLGDEITKALQDNFDPKTLPGEAKLLGRFQEAPGQGPTRVSPRDFGALIISGLDTRRKAELLVQYAELGGVVTKELLQQDCGDLDGMVARATKAAQQLRGGSVDLNMLVLDRFGTDTVRALISYAERRANANGVRACTDHLTQLNDYADSPIFGERIVQMVKDLGVIAQQSNARESQGLEPTDGIGNVIRGCLALLSEHAHHAAVGEGSLSKATNDRALIPAVNGFAAEAEVGRKFIAAGHHVTAMGRHIPLGHGQGEKELDTLVELHGAGESKAVIAVEVKANRNALEHALQTKQLIRLAQAARLCGATPVLLINEPGLGSDLIGKLARVSDECRAITGQALTVVGPNLKPIGLNPHQAPPRPGT